LYAEKTKKLTSCPRLIPTNHGNLCIETKKKILQKVIPIILGLAQGIGKPCDLQIRLKGDKLKGDGESYNIPVLNRKMLVRTDNSLIDKRARIRIPR
jgi:hypothetical protein